ncbi:hypothetical protein P3T36_005366 [Kitasatospora sp. MAP12-15]|uniref:hypothetical protein n=1 Tax=unclassified Kitasatospora TaxID=2633591 RepID=UPI002476257B|nr:hypothetical protein [Kitasatospora sp. MAP12-44]MDH6109833.1 hypothetical protein [Kitasatospora sp. MAP12-44]
MDPDMAALAGSAGSTVVALMATDAYQRTREGVLALWRRVHPDRAEAVAAELDATRDELLSARAGGDPLAEQELQSEWQGRLRRLLAADPTAADQLRRLIAEVSPAAEAAAGPIVRQSAEAHGHGRVYQAGRDQHITER